MNHNRFAFVIVFVAAFVSLLIFLGPNTIEAQEDEPRLPAAAKSAIGTAFTYQGRLTDGGLPANGNYDFRFYMWGDEGKTTLLGTFPESDSIVIDVVDGYFATTLDFGVGIFDGNERWVEIEVNGTLLSPLQSITPAPYAIYAQTAPWSGLIDVPVGFADGTDDGMSSVTWLDILNRPSGLDDGDDDTTYSPGYGLGLDNTTFNVMTDTIQTRVTGTCGVGYAMRQVNADGSVVCEEDDNTTYSNGDGLELTGTVFSVDFAGSGSATTVAHSDHDHGDLYWLLNGNSGTNPGTNYLGTSDNQALELRVNNQRALYLEPNEISPNVIGGFNGNYALEGVHGAVIAGGGTPDEDSVFSPNRVTDHYGAVVGGANNQAGDDALDLGNAIYAFVGGGAFNSARGGFSSVVGGDANQAYGTHVAIGGGMVNVAWGPGTTISGGEWNQAGGINAAVGGGSTNHALGDYSTIGGGVAITVTGYAGTVAGGEYNIADGERSTIGGGLGNDTIGAYSSIGGGYANVAQAGYSTIAGGMTNDTLGEFSVVGGGYDNASMNAYSTVGGGSMNVAWADYATICGGGPLDPNDPLSHNQITDNFGTIGGGADHNVGSHDGDPTNAPFATISGGVSNSASGGYAFIGGGMQDLSSGEWSAVCGGRNNTASGDDSIIGGGNGQTASGWYSYVGGGTMNTASDDVATISGGSANSASGPGSSVGGGYSNAANGTYGTVGGGDNNIANNINSTVGGGHGNFAYGDSSTIAGGNDNYILSGSTNGTIAGGEENLVTDEGGMVGGGYDNQAGNNTGSSNDATYVFIGGGYGNTGSANSAVVAGGYDNIASGGYSFIGGGDSNIAGGGYGSIGGGRYNQAAGLSATVGGGDHNQALANYATVGGGGYNTASGLGSVVAGGGGIHSGWIFTNTASGDWSTVSGGNLNTASGLNSTVGGGDSNTASNYAATISGGSFNNASGSGSSVGGGNVNAATSTYATVGGGMSNTATDTYATVGGGESNEATGNRSTVAGGYNNSASNWNATVAGGNTNTASGGGAFIGGGDSNTASGAAATVPGGYDNDAGGDYSFAAGYKARIHADGDGSFVWSDSSSEESIWSYGPNQFLARATGGFWLVTGINEAGGFTSGLRLATGSSTWTTTSDRNAKTNFAPVDGREVLDLLSNISVETWNYKTQDASIRHMGPMAQDFYAAYDLGLDERHIDTVDLDGVALAAIQGLYAISQDQADQIENLQAENQTLRQQLGRAFQESPSHPLSILVYALAGLVLLLLVGFIWMMVRMRNLLPTEVPNVR